MTQVSQQAVIDEFSSDPFWWQGAPLASRQQPLPESRVDVVVVGAGYSGLFTALTLARGGREVVVLDADRAGEHASTRNFGAIGRTIRLSFSELAVRDGLDVAKRVYEEAKDWVEFTAGFIEREGIDCRFVRNGRVVAAHTSGAFDAMARELEAMTQHVEVDTTMVPANEQSSELGSDIYHGCSVLHDVGHLDPGRYHASLQRLAIDAGVTLIDQTRVIGINNEREQFDIDTSRGQLSARQVVLATNAETGRDNGLFRYFQRRLVQIPLYSAVSERLPTNVMKQLFPRGRTMLETRRLYTALRPIEGESRFLVVGQHMRPHRDLRNAATALKADVVMRYPVLESMRFSHIWRGRFAVTFDWLPHFGRHEGVHYLIGLNGAGVPAAGYLGHQLALQMMGKPNRSSVFADRPYPTKTGYWGSAWFLPPLAAWLRRRDAREAGLPR